jgi:hypothetical protein
VSQRFRPLLLERPWERPLPFTPFLPTATRGAEAIDYAETRACFRTGEIRVLDSTGELERTIAFNESDRI